MVLFSKKYITAILTLFSISCGYSQLCQGSFGDAVFTEDFGNNSETGTTRGVALAAGVTTYSYVGNGNTENGQYTIGTNANIGKNSFYNMMDHTTDTEGDGYMFIVNADESQGEFYRKEVTALCEDQVYQFSAYLANILPTTSNPNAVPVNVIFRVENADGSILGEYETGNIPSVTNPEWEAYSFDFSLSGSSSVQVVLINNTAGGMGNDLAIDDISFRPCGSTEMTVATDYENFEDGVCETETVSFEVNIEDNPYNNPTYQWQYSANDGTSWTNLNGETNETISINGFQEGYLYRYLAFEAENIDSPYCQIASDPITISFYETPAYTPDPIEKCDQNEDGTAIFDLTETIEMILGGANENNFSVSFHPNEEDATNNDNAIISATSYENQSLTETLYVRVEEAVKGCFNIAPVELILHSLPSWNIPLTLYQCDDDTDGISLFNLSEIESEFTNTNSLDFTYYTSEIGAEEALASALIVNTESFSNSELNTVFFRATNALGCYKVGQIELVVTVSQIPEDYLITLDACDIGSSSEFETADFSLEETKNTILSLFPTTQNLEVSFYTNEANALMEHNAVNSENYQNISNPQTLFVRIDNKINNSCFALSKHVKLMVNPLPQFELEAIQILCIDEASKTVYIENANAEYTYEWFNENNNTIGYGDSIDLQDSGTYYVVGSNTETECTLTKSYDLATSDIASIDEIKISSEMNGATVSVDANGVGNYEYSLDGVNYQDAAVFENVSGGNYTLYVNDINGCGEVSINICVPGFPKFFTPNADSINDYWQLSGITNNCPNIAGTIQIFDRYGSLLTQFNTSDTGWDGTFNGINMPASDYWFSVHFTDSSQKDLNSHFSLIR